MEIKIVKELSRVPSGAKQVLVKGGKKFFVVSSVTVPMSGFETLVFPANSRGKITDFIEVAGGRGYTRKRAIEALKKLLEA